MIANRLSDRVPQPQVRTALLLAAGTGSRLHPLTQFAPKCLTEVHGVPILDQQVRCLEELGFERLVIVSGHMKNRLREYLEQRTSKLQIDYIYSPLYRTTNNIYSLWLAREVLREPFLLLESDLFFEPSLLAPMLQEDCIAVSTLQPWMTGTTVVVDGHQRVVSMQVGASAIRVGPSLKTVNIYTLSTDTWRQVIDRLDHFVTAGKVRDYYEVVFSELIAEGAISLRPILFDHKQWCEIDTVEDLREAERIFSRLVRPPSSRKTKVLG